MKGDNGDAFGGAEEGREFLQDKVTWTSQWTNIVKTVFKIPELFAITRPPQDLGPFHPESLLNPESAPFQCFEDDDLHTRALSRPVLACRQKRIEENKKVDNFKFDEKNVFWPLSQREFTRIPDDLFKGTGKMSAAIKDLATPNAEREDSPVIVETTQVFMRLRATSKTEKFYNMLLREYQFKRGVKQPKLMTKDDHWLLFHPSAMVNKRECVRRTRNNQRTLHDCIGTWGHNNAVVQVRFHLCASYDEYMFRASEWDGNHLEHPDSTHDTPIFVAEISDDGKIVPFSVPEANSTEPEFGRGVSVYVPDYKEWNDRNAVEWTRRVLGRSNFYTKPIYVEELLQKKDGVWKSRVTVEAEYERERKAHKAAKKRRRRRKRRGTTSADEDPLPKFKVLNARELGRGLWPVY